MANFFLMMVIFFLAAGVGYVTVGAALFIVALPALLFVDVGAVWEVTSGIGAVVGGIAAILATYEMDWGI